MWQDLYSGICFTKYHYSIPQGGTTENNFPTKACLRHPPQVSWQPSTDCTNSVASTYCTITINVIGTQIRQYSDAGTALSPLGASIMVTIQQFKQCGHRHVSTWSKHCGIWQCPTYTNIRQSSDAGTALSPLGASTTVTIQK